MKLVEIGHLAFICKDLEKSIAYYRDGLGMKHKFNITFGEWLDHILATAKANGTEPDPEQVKILSARRDEIWIAYFDLGNGQFFELFDPQGAEISRVPQNGELNYNHVSIVLDDIHEAYKELLARGVPIDSAPALGLETTWQMWSHDPDGNRIEFMQYTPTSWQLTGH